MREGLLLAEDSPETIIRELESDTLESAFLKLCIRQEANYEPRDNLENGRLPAICNGNMETTLIRNGHNESKNMPKKKLAKEQLKALFKKNVLAIYRQPSGIFFIIFFPIIQILCIYGALGGDPKGLKIGIVNDELSNYKDCINQSYVTAFPQNAECHMNKISCRFLHHLNDSVAIKVKIIII
jgi:hypothetical protein